MAQLYVNKPLRPMLAAAIKDTSLAALDKLPYPLFASPKIDGIRALSYGDQFHTRSGKLIPNQFIQSFASMFSNLDGELTVGDNFQDSTSAVMSRDGYPQFTYWIFDTLSTNVFYKRLEQIQMLEYDTGYLHAKVVPQVVIQNTDELLVYESEVINEGFEGLCLRKPDALYKQGRSTMREAALLKLKRFVDGEAEIIGFEELMINGNDQSRSPLGYAEHSSHKDGLIPAGTLGAFVVRDNSTGQTFNIGTGFTAAQRAEFWHFRGTSLLGTLVKYKHFPHGVKELPRHPVFLGFRDKEDLS